MYIYIYIYILYIIYIYLRRVHMESDKNSKNNFIKSNLVFPILASYIHEPTVQSFKHNVHTDLIGETEFKHTKGLVW